MIKLKDGWQIETDGMQYILCQEKTVTKEGKNIGATYIGDKSFHTSLKSAISSLMNRYQMAVIEKDELTLNEALQKFKELNDEFKVILDKVESLERL